MGDSVRMEVNEAWQAIPSLTLGETYGFQNTVNQSMFLQQQASAPEDSETGFELSPFKMAIITKEASDVFVRMRSGEGIAFFNQLV